MAAAAPGRGVRLDSNNPTAQRMATRWLPGAGFPLGRGNTACAQFAVRLGKTGWEMGSAGTGTGMPVSRVTGPVDTVTRTPKTGTVA